MRTRPHLTLFAAGVISAALYAIFGPPPAIKGGGEMVSIGQSLAETGIYGHAFSMTMNTGPTAVVAPLFPAYIGALIRLFGGGMAWIILAAGVILVQGLHASLLPRLSRVVFGSAAPGICAAGICILLPVYSWMPYWDAIYSATAVMLFCLGTERLRVDRGIRAPIAVALAAGLLALLNPNTLVISISWTAFLLYRRRTTWRRATQFCGVGVAVILAVLLPWVIRNYARFGGLTFRTGLGMALYASNNDCATPSMISELWSGCHNAHHPFGSMADARLLIQLGEVEYDRTRMADAMAWMRAHSSRFASLTAQRIVEFWFPSLDYGLTGFSIGLATLLFIPGFLLMDRTPHWKWMAAVFLIYPCVYYVVISDYRYRYPILWLSLLPAGYAIALALDWIGRRVSFVSWISDKKYLNI
jgi:hypothetical protein